MERKKTDRMEWRGKQIIRMYWRERCQNLSDRKKEMDCNEKEKEGQNVIEREEQTECNGEKRCLNAIEDMNKG